MIDEQNYYLIMECHLYCYTMLVDCNNNYTVHYKDYNMVMDDYIHMNNENDDDNNTDLSLMMVLKDNNIDRMKDNTLVDK